jgi:hypothetical protein
MEIRLSEVVAALSHALDITTASRSATQRAPA